MFLGAKKIINIVATGRYSCSMYWRYYMFIHITLAGSRFSSGTLPTMHLIYVYYTDIHQGLKIFANSCIYIYMDRVVLALATYHIVHSILFLFPLWSYNPYSGTDSIYRIVHSILFVFSWWPCSSDSGTDIIPRCSFNTFPLPPVAL